MIVEKDGALVLYNGVLGFGGDDMCYCCPYPPYEDPPCCIRLTGGTFDVSTGDLIYETSVLTIAVEMPTPWSRIVCDGETVTLNLTLKEPYASEPGPYRYHFWLDRDWRPIAWGGVGDDQIHKGANWAVWDGDAPTSSLTIEWTKCWQNYAEQYGDIQFGTDVGALGEVIEINAVDTETPSETDCCDFVETCEECKFVYQYVGEPIGPEQTGEGMWTYWFDLAGGWSVRIRVVSGPDEITKAIGRGQQIILDVAIRPPKTKYTDPLTSSDVCFQLSDGWKQPGGSDDHPTDPPVAWGFAANCPPASYTPYVGNCPTIIRTQAETPALEFQFQATVKDCYDDCGIREEPLELDFTAQIVSDGVTLSADVPAPLPCDDLDVCCPPCENPEVILYEVFRGTFEPDDFPPLYDCPDDDEDKCFIIWDQWQTACEVDPGLFEIHEYFVVVSCGTLATGTELEDELDACVFPENAFEIDRANPCIQSELDALWDYATCANPSNPAGAEPTPGTIEDGYCEFCCPGEGDTCFGGGEEEP